MLRAPDSASAEAGATGFPLIEVLTKKGGHDDRFIALTNFAATDVAPIPPEPYFRLAGDRVGLLNEP